MRRIMFPAVLALAGTFVLPAPGWAQAERSQHAELRERLAALDAVVERVDELDHRARDLDEEIHTRMHAMNRAREQARFRQYDHLMSVCDATMETLDEVRVGIEEIRALALNPAFRTEEELKTQVDRLREEWSGVVAGLEASVGVLETIYLDLESRTSE